MISEKVWLHGFAEEFTTNFTKMFTRHYSKTHDSKLAQKLGGELLKAREGTLKEIASALLKHTKLSHEKIARYCYIDSETLNELANNNANNNTKEGKE